MGGGTMHVNGCMDCTSSWMNCLPSSSLHTPAPTPHNGWPWAGQFHNLLHKCTVQHRPQSAPPPSATTQQPHKHPHSPLQALYKSKVVSEQEAGQWRKPCPYELQAALQCMIQPPATAPPPSPNRTQPPTPDSLAADANSAAAAFAADTAASSEGEGGSPVRRASSSSSEGPGLSSSGSIDSGAVNNEGMVEGAAAAAGGKTQLAVIFLVDSSGSVGDGEQGGGAVGRAEVTGLPVCGLKQWASHILCCCWCFRLGLSTCLCGMLLWRLSLPGLGTAAGF